MGRTVWLLLLLTSASLLAGLFNLCLLLAGLFLPPYLLVWSPCAYWFDGLFTFPLSLAVCLTSASPLAGLFAGEKCVPEQLLCFPGVDGPLEIPGSSQGKLGWAVGCYGYRLGFKDNMSVAPSPTLSPIFTEPWPIIDHLVSDFYFLLIWSLFIQERPLRAGTSTVISSTLSSLFPGPQTAS